RGCGGVPQYFPLPPRVGEQNPKNVSWKCTRQRSARAANAGGREMPVSTEGLRDVIAGRTAISTVDGLVGRLIYRGYDIHDLAINSTFEETAYLIWHGQLPTRRELDDASAQLAAGRPL